ncbi:MAG: response regulator [Deltaproteobacteria bacterium]|jgi:FixJ family two-component response regulator
MKEGRNLVVIVDDEPSIRKGLARLLGGSHGFDVMTFASAQELLAASLPDDEPCCLLLDVNLPDLNGLELQTKLLGRKHAMATVFITGYADIPLSVRAMKIGAIDFLTKPVDEEDLLIAVQEACRQARQLSISRQEDETIKKQLSSLTPREQEVLAHVVSGFLNKQIAYALNISEKTVKVHRARVMQKLGVASLVELVRLADNAGVRKLPLPAE